MSLSEKSVIIISPCNAFEPNHIWWDKGSGANRNVTFWRPALPDGFYSLGDYAQGDYDQPIGTVMAVRAADESNAVLAHPTGYELVWSDRGSGSNTDGAIWYPVPPAGYVSLGMVVTNNYNPPSTDAVVCVRSDCVVAANADALIWNDRGSDANHDVSVYAIAQQPGVVVSSGSFYAQPDYNPPKTFFGLKAALTSAR